MLENTLLKIKVPGLVQDLIEGFQGYCLGHRRKFRKVRSKAHRILPAKLQLPKSFDKAPISKSVLLYPNKDAMDIPRVRILLYHQFSFNDNVFVEICCKSNT